MEQASVEAAIRAQLLSSPDAQNLTQEEFDGLVSSLAQNATEQGVTKESLAIQESLPEETPVLTDAAMPPLSQPVLVLVCVLLAGLILWVFKKMRSGGGLGPHEMS